MPDLNDWIKAQQKRGYSKSKIKEVLSKHGYPQSAISKVDKVEYENPSLKTPSKKATKIVFSLILAVIISLLIIVWLFSLPANKDDSKQPSITRIRPDLPQGYIESVSKPVEVLCANFSKIDGEISCKDAVKMALQKYPGALINIKKTEYTLPFADSTGILYKETFKIWAIRVLLYSIMDFKFLDGNVEARGEVTIAVPLNGTGVYVYEI